MRRWAFLLILTGATIFSTGIATDAQACKLFKLLFHKCHACHRCGGHECGYRKCDRPKCHCGHGHHHRRFFGPMYGPAYPEYPAEPTPAYEEVQPGGRAF